MSARAFQLILTLPPDARFAVTAREVAVMAAARTGCGDESAQEFGRHVEGAVRRGLARGRGGQPLPVTVQCTGGPVEVLVDGQTLALQV